MQINLKLPTSWRTTLAGVVAGALGFVQMYKIHDWKMIVQDPTTLFMFIAAIGLALAKDSNVTGGTTAATPEASARIANQSTTK